MASLKELMEQITRAQHRARVFEYIIEQLNPCLDPDVGVAERLRADGCLIPDVPQDVVVSVIGEHVAELQRLANVIQRLEQGPVKTPKTKNPKAKTAPKKEVASETTSKPKLKKHAAA